MSAYTVRNDTRLKKSGGRARFLVLMNDVAAVLFSYSYCIDTYNLSAKKYFLAKYKTVPFLNP